MKKTLSLIIASLILSTLILSSCSKQPRGNNGSGIDVPPLFTFADVNLDEFKKDSSEIILADDTVFFLTEVGEVYGLGANKYCELGLGHNLKAEKAVRVPIEEKITKIRALDGRVFFISENDTLYRTGRKDDTYWDPEINIVEFFTVPYKIEALSDSKVIDAAVYNGEPYSFALLDKGENSEMVSMETREDGKTTANMIVATFPDKIVSLKSTMYMNCALSANGGLYRSGWFYDVGGRQEEKIVTKAAEDVLKYWTTDAGIYYINTNGELFAAGRIEDYDGNDLCLGINREKYSKYILKNTIYPTNLYTYEFCKIDMPEKVINYLDFGDAKAVIGESGKVYVWGDYNDLPKNFLPEGETDKRYPVFSGYTFENIENLEKIVSNRQNHLDITYAVKYSGENWKICFNDESRGVSVGEEIDIKNLPWWK